MSASAPLLGLPGTTAVERSDVHVQVGPRDCEPEPQWGDARALAYHDASAPLEMSVRSLPERGHLMQAPAFAWATITRGADMVVITPTSPGEWRWQRYLLAQVLPFVAGLHGFELLHAAGLVVGDLGVALLGPSGIGKSTIAAEMVSRGAAFLADDVLALGEDDGTVLAHPGPAMIVMARTPAIPSGGAWKPPIAGEGDELAFPLATAPVATLGTLVVLARSRGAPSLTELRPGDPRPLLAACYESVRRDRSRLARQLSLFSTLASQARLVRLEFEPGRSVDEVTCLLLDGLVTGGAAR